MRQISEKIDGGGPVAANVPLNEVSVRAYRYFHKEWPAVAGEVWYKMDGQKDISPEMAVLIRDKYPSFQIKVVTEVSGLDRTAYYVTIENSAQVKTLSIVDGNMEVLSDLANGDGPGSVLAQN
ncbi:MAG TPA: hypothetical protein VHD83_15150 [Puia sp.]|nr:hypothetical protein [Puia sp.]